MSYNLRSRTRARLPEPEASAEQGQMEEENQVALVLSPQKKALSNEYILKEIFDYLPVEDLLECRIVNKVWNEVATRVFAPRAPMVQFWDFSNNSKIQIGPPNKFMEVMRNSRNNPCRKFYVFGDILKKCATCEEHLMLAKFFEKVASYVIYLEIGTVACPIFPQVTAKEELEYPKLKSLELRLSSFDGLEAHVDAMIGILKYAPNLESISLGFSKSEKDEFFRLVEQVSWTQIQHLTLLNEVEDEDFKKIMEITGSNLKLKSFRCKKVTCVGNPPRLGDNFDMFLERQQNTLQTLKLEQNKINLGTGFGLPEQLPKLKTLEVDSILQIHAGLYIPISERFPILSSISLYWQSWTQLEQLFPTEGQPPVETVKTLEFKLGQIEMHPQWRGVGGQVAVESRVQRIIRQAAQIFPDVQNLTIPAISIILKVIGVNKAWEKVEKLKLLCGDVGAANSALTGYRPEVDKNILQFLNQVQVLELQHKGAEKYCLTEMCCQKVLLRLGNLRCLDLRNHKPCEVFLSDTVVREMQEKFQVMRMKPKK